MAPEIIRREGYEKPADVWSIGVMTYIMLSNQYPFDITQKSDFSTYSYIPNYNIEMFDNIDSNGIDFIEKLLIVDTKRRLTIEEALQHTWIAA